MRYIRKKNGYFLIEIMILLGILSFSILYIQSIQKGLSNLTLRSALNQSLQSFIHAKLLALHHNNDTIIQSEQNSLTIRQNNHLRHTLHYPKGIHSTINHRGYLGFKPNGNSKSAGRLTLTNTLQTHEIRLGVGIGKWTHYHNP